MARRVRIEPLASHHFSISGPQNVGQTKIAPGMSVTYTISFKAEEVKDYQYDLVCVTEREKFIIPVRAIGLRGMYTCGCVCSLLFALFYPSWMLLLFVVSYFLCFAC